MKSSLKYRIGQEPGGDRKRQLISLRMVMTAILITLLSAGCIHTYPSPEASVDPTEIEVALLLYFDENWDALAFATSDNNGADSEQPTRAQDWPRRIYLQLSGREGSSKELTRIVEADEIADGTYRLSLPSKLKADIYDIALWCDYLNPTTMEPFGYDISMASLIRELEPRGSESAKRNCLTANLSIDLRKYAGEWEVSEEIPVTLTSPMARFKIVAEDYSDFLETTHEARLHGEKYYVRLDYLSDIPGGFSMTDGQAMDPVAGAGMESQLFITTIPGVEMSVASDWLFNPPTRHIHTVRISVFNSAKSIISQTPEISFPTERGMITTVSGKILTNFITGGIRIDNIWAGEVIIDVD